MDFIVNEILQNFGTGFAEGFSKKGKETRFFATTP
jgi:hypothetical protein